MEEIKATVISSLESYRLDSTKQNLKVLYDLYNEIYFFGYQKYSVPKKHYKDFKKRCGGGCDIHVINNLKLFVGLSIEEINKSVYLQRLGICKRCEFHKQYLALTTCGTIYIGEDTPHGKLCGCIMQIKCNLKDSKCCLDSPKW